MQLEYATYRLLYHRPFGTGHGFRDGTDAVFIRMGAEGAVGYGEATLPPYLSESPKDVIDALYTLQQQGITLDDLKLPGNIGPAARAAITTAHFDLLSKLKGEPVLKLRHEAVHRRTSVMTIGVTEPADLPEALFQLPPFKALKVKLNGDRDKERLSVILHYDERPVLIDANRSWTRLDQALGILDLAGDRCIGLEQPFNEERSDLQNALMKRSPVVVYADEAIRNIEDLERLNGTYSGVNIKLMKCGGLDKAFELATAAKAMGMRVMLGSMSESSLGCGAMMQLAPLADILDLDGPWLIQNDPFEGLTLGRDGELELAYPDDLGSGVRAIQPDKLNWSPIGA